MKVSRKCGAIGCFCVTLQPNLPIYRLAKDFRNIICGVDSDAYDNTVASSASPSRLFGGYLSVARILWS